ncbi:hypothetical protein [Hymenobacter montanus]|nr:hypothetical protein [Hymenobacter montanus]
MAGVYDDTQTWCHRPALVLEDVRAPVLLWHGTTDGARGCGNIA